MSHEEDDHRNCPFCITDPKTGERLCDACKKHTVLFVGLCDMCMAKYIFYENDPEGYKKWLEDKIAGKHSEVRKDASV